MGVKDNIEVDEEKVLARSEEVFKELQNKYGGPEAQRIKMQRGEITEADLQKDFANAQQIIFEEFLLNPVMEKNSIHPKFRDDMSELLKAIGAGYISSNPTRNPTYYKYIKITDEEFNADPICANQHKEHFSDTMQMLKNNWGY